jgi:CheY-like chemotaxis protein
MGRARHILVVEDDSATRDVLILILEKEGFTVSGAANGREALERLQWMERPSLILLDLMMPVMDGWQFREAQKQDPALASIPVVVVSAAGNLPQEIASLDIAGYLKKPVGFDEILEAIQRYC